MRKSDIGLHSSPPYPTRFRPERRQAEAGRSRTSHLHRAATRALLALARRLLFLFEYVLQGPCLPHVHRRLARQIAAAGGRLVALGRWCRSLFATNFHPSTGACLGHNGYRSLSLAVLPDLGEMPSSHSQTSSFGDIDYYGGAAGGVYSSHSPSSSYSNSSANPPPLRTGSASREGFQSSTGVRKQASLANIAVPSFSAFRNQVSNIPVSSPSSNVRRKPAPGQSQSSPRVVSFSAAEKASPRLAEPGTRPYSLESPAIQGPTGLASVISPPLTEDDTTPQGDRYGAAFSKPYLTDTDVVQNLLSLPAFLPRAQRLNRFSNRTFE